MTGPGIPAPTCSSSSAGEPNGPWRRRRTAPAPRSREVLDPQLVGPARRVQRVAEQHQPGRRQALGHRHRAHAPAVGAAAEHELVAATRRPPRRAPRPRPSGRRRPAPCRAPASPLRYGKSTRAVGSGATADSRVTRCGGSVGTGAGGEQQRAGGHPSSFASALRRGAAGSPPSWRPRPRGRAVRSAVGRARNAARTAGSPRAAARSAGTSTSRGSVSSCRSTSDFVAGRDTGAVAVLGTHRDQRPPTITPTVVR